jgi:diaminopimelate epimerase
MMPSIVFTKMSGSGNDFILIDNRRGVVDETRLAEFVTGICRRRLSVGADGVILIEDSPQADFRWRFFNSDGSPAAMCGNGARCAARFAYREGIAGQTMEFETAAGRIAAQVSEPRVSVRLTPPHGLALDVPLALAGGTRSVSRINTGVPHAVIAVDDLEGTDVPALGREVRRHPDFAPEGTNANFVQEIGPGRIALRTYERGVEGETLACGTGAVAAALVTAAVRGWSSPVSVLTRGGETLTVHFRRSGAQFSDVRQEGLARMIYTGELWPEAWQ